jgi:hypothetical protein
MQVRAGHVGALLRVGTEAVRHRPRIQQQARHIDLHGLLGMTCSGPRRTQVQLPGSSSPSSVLMPHSAPAWNTEAVTAERSSRMARRSTMTGLRVKRDKLNVTDRIGISMERTALAA